MKELIGGNVKLQKVLERLYTRYNRAEMIKPDPLQFVYLFAGKEDREIAGLVASCLAYGRVGQIEASLRRLFSLIGQNPLEYAVNFSSAEQKMLEGFRHRFNSGDDIAELMRILRKIYRQGSCIEDVFADGYSKDDLTVAAGLEKFRKAMMSIGRYKSKGDVPKGLGYLLPEPANRSPCKRLNMFLRWMVRKDNVDPGVWRKVKASALLMPMDANISHIAGVLGLYNKKNITLETAVEVTRAFAQIEPEDPVKYDFCLCRVGMFAKAQTSKDYDELVRASG